MWELALIVTAQLILSYPESGGPGVAGDNVCAPTLLAGPVLIQDGDEEERKVIYTGACGGFYKADDGVKNVCCDQNERPQCYSDGGCECSYDPHCQSLCQPSGTCSQSDC